MRGIVVIFLLGFAACLLGEDTKAQVVFVLGTVEVGQGQDWRAVVSQEAIGPDASVRTGPGASARLSLAGHMVEVDGNSEISIASLSEEEEGGLLVRFRLLAGSLMAKVAKLGKRDLFEIETPTAVVGVRGTEFEVTATNDGSDVEVYEGSVDLCDRRDLSRRVRVGARFYARFRQGVFPGRLERISEKRVLARQARWLAFKKYYSSNAGKNLKLWKMKKRQQLRREKFRRLRQR